MKINQKYFFTTIFLFVIYLFFYSKASLSKQQSNSPNELIVKYKFESSLSQTSLQKTAKIQQDIQLEKIRNSIGSTYLKPLIKPDLLEGLRDVSLVDEYFILDYDANVSLNQVQSLLKSVPEIIHVEPVKYYKLDLEFVPNDPEYSKQLHLPQINAPAAWDISQGDSTIVIAIVDNGFDLNHSDLKSNYWQNLDEVNGLSGIDDDGNGFIDDINGYDFAEDDADPSFLYSNLKENSHGTHISGIAGAIGNNQIGGTGVSWYSKILPLKVFRDDDPLLTSSKYSLPGIVYAINKGAKIINLSWGGLGEPSAAEQDVMNLAYRNGVMVICAAGNDNSDKPHFPSNYHHVISVGAVNSTDQKALYSNFGNSVDIMAPGNEIFSTFVENKYGIITGTSMSAPIVAGVAALVWSQNPSLTVDQVITKVVFSADNIDSQNPGYLTQLGHGRVNAFRALTENKLPEPKAKIGVDQFVVNDSLFGNNNHLIEKNETITFFITLINYSLGSEPSLGVTITTPEDSEIIWQTRSQTVFAPADSHFAISEPFVCTIPEDYSHNFVKLVVELSGNNVVAKQDTLIFQVGTYPILIVDDDDGINNVEEYYTLPLESLDIPFAVWDYHKLGTPDSSFINNFPIIIWYCNGSQSNLSLQDRNVLETFLLKKGNLFLSGQDIGFDLADPASSNSDESARLFFQNYLKANYISDNAKENKAKGVPGDIIGNELDFYLFQPGLASKQSPDIIEPINPANHIFFYDHFKGVGGIRYNGNYRLVYLGFGMEAINSGISLQPGKMDPIRSQVYYRILNFLHPFRHKPIADQTNTGTTIDIFAENLEPGKLPVNVRLYYKYSQNPDFNSLNLRQNETNFSGELPLTNQLGEVLYYFEIQDQNYSWFSPIEGKTQPYSFRVGGDNKAPEIFLLETPNQFSFQTEYPICATIKDNAALDSSSLYLVYKKRGAEIDSSLMIFQPAYDQFEGKIAGDFIYGDTISYWIIAGDQANPANISQSKMYQFVIGLENFETGLLNWDLSPGGWNLDSSEVHSGNFAIKTIPYDNYLNDSDISFTTKNHVDLTNPSFAELQFYTKYIIESGDEGSVEIKIGTQNWQTISGPFTGFQGAWKLVRVNLSPFSGNQNCLLRFRFLTNNIQTVPLKGWTIDDVRIVQDQYITSVNYEKDNTVPTQFYLSKGFPNPFRKEVKFELSMPQNVDVSIFIYNILGQIIKNFTLSTLKENHKLYWDGTNDSGSKLPTGIYIVKAISGRQNFARKVVLIR